MKRAIVGSIIMVAWTVLVLKGITFVQWCLSNNYDDVGIFFFLLLIVATALAATVAVCGLVGNNNKKTKRNIISWEHLPTEKCFCLQKRVNVYDCGRTKDVAVISLVEDGIMRGYCLFLDVFTCPDEFVSSCTKGKSFAKTGEETLSFDCQKVDRQSEFFL